MDFEFIDICPWPDYSFTTVPCSQKPAFCAGGNREAAMKSLIALGACGALLALAGATLLGPNDAARAQAQTDFARFAKVQKWVGTFTLESKWDKEQKLINDETRRAHLSWRATAYFELNFSESAGNADYKWIGEQCRATASVDESGLIEGRYGERSYTTLKGEQTKDCAVPPTLDIFPENRTYTLVFPLIVIDAQHSQYGTQPATLLAPPGAFTGPLPSGSDLVLSGSVDTHPDHVVVPNVLDLGGKLEELIPLHVSWEIAPAGQVDAEAVIIPPKDYPNWQPQAGDDEKTAGNSLVVVTAKIYKKGHPQEPSRQKAQFKFELVDVSKEKGVCLNWPSTGATDDFDLQIDPLANLELTIGDEKRQSATSEKGLDESKVKITSYDWGAWGKLKVTAVFRDGTEVPAHLEGDKAKNELVIPKDDNGNHIADAWEKKNGVYGKKAEADDESSPEGDDHPGDGLTLYEEYRGFIENGQHIFGDPKKKDLFICNKIGQMAALGLSIFENISGLAVHSKLKPGGKDGAGELDTSRVINRNHTNRAHIVDQHGVFIDKGDEGLTSMASPLSGFEPTPGPPKKFEKVKIGLGFLAEKFSAYERASVVAHELLHCCSVWHHGDIDQGMSKFQTKTDAAGVQRIYMFNVDGAGNATGPGAAVILINEKTGAIIPPGNRGILVGLTIWIGSKQGQHSGDTDCVMRYACAYGYKDNSGNYEIFADREKFGLDICPDGQGTGVNEPGRKPEPRYGNATAGKGNCPKQICVNDKYH
jgi:hypothetical protein